MLETLDEHGACGNENKFFQGLDRWYIFFVTGDAVAYGTYREAVQMIWGIVLRDNESGSERAETLIYFQDLVST
jgi:hypothetical protein